MSYISADQPDLVRHKIVIEYETPHYEFGEFSPAICEMKAKNAVADFLAQYDRLWRDRMESVFKITSSTNKKDTSVG